MSNFKTLIIIPYLPLQSGLQLNNVLIWSFKNRQNQMIPNVTQRAYITRLLSCYKTPSGHPIDNPAIISIGRPNFCNPTTRSIEKIEIIKNILLFAGVWEINNWSFITSDNFEVFYQRFTFGGDRLATSGGSIHRVTVGGYFINQLSFVKPDHINIPISLRLFNGSILAALMNCYNNQASDIQKNQIIQSLNPFFNAYRNSHELSGQTRVLNLIMAFELLFGHSSRGNFRNEIGRLSNYGSPPQPSYTYPEINTTDGSLIRNRNLTYNQIWAEEFYKLRHKVIHGNLITRSDFIFADLLGMTTQHDPHFYIAVNFYVICLLNKLRDLGFNSVPKFIIEPNSTNPLAKNISGIQNELFKMVQIF